MRIIAVLLLSYASLSAQQRPKVDAVVSSGDCRPGITFSGLASIFGENLSDTEYSATTLPLPTKLGSTEVFLCELAGAFGPNANPDISIDGCVSLGLLYAGPNQLNILMPDSLPQHVVGGSPSEGWFTVRVAGVVDSDSYNGSQVAYNQLDYVAPRIFFMGYDCFIDPRYQDWGKSCGLSWYPGAYARAQRGAITDVFGNLISSARPAKLGEWYVIWLTGLGLSKSGKPLVPVSLWISNVPVYGYSGWTWFGVSPDYVGVVPGFVGLDQINFKLPISIATGNAPYGYPPWPCGDYTWEVSLMVRNESDMYGGWEESNLVMIPIVVSNGDVPCDPAR